MVCMDDASRTPDEIERILAEHPEARILDVRTRESRDASVTMPDSELLDVNADLKAGNLDVLLDQGLPDDAPIVVVCNTGGKCTKAANYLREHGYDAVSVRGGMQAWEGDGKPIDPATSD
jgi:rhodanese-related sulfurtransferase